MIAFLLLISTAFADPLTTSLRKGDVAPFSGTLLNEEAVAKIIATQEADKALCDARVKLEADKKDSEMALNNDILSARILSCEKSLSKANDDYNELVKKYNRKSAIMPYAVSGSFLGGIALTILIASAVNGAVQ